MIAPERRAVAVRPAGGPGGRRPSRGGSRRRTATPGLADDAVSIPIPHERICGMIPGHRGDPVCSRLGAADAPVAVVVPLGNRLRSGGCGSRRCRHRTAREHDHLRRGAPRQHSIQRVGLTPVDGEPVLLPNGDDPSRVPAAVPRREPLGRVVVDLLVPVHAWAGQREVQQVSGEPPLRRSIGGAQPAVVRLRASDEVLDVGLGVAGEPTPRIGP